MSLLVWNVKIVHTTQSKRIKCSQFTFYLKHINKTKTLDNSYKSSLENCDSLKEFYPTLVVMLWAGLLAETSRIFNFCIYLGVTISAKSFPNFICQAVAVNDGEGFCVINQRWDYLELLTHPQVTRAQLLNFKYFLKL